MQKLTEKQLKVAKLIAPMVKSILNEAYIPKPGTYKLEMTVDTDGSVVVTSNDVSFKILANVIGVGSGNTKKFGEFYGQMARTEFLFFTPNKSDLFK